MILKFFDEQKDDVRLPLEIIYHEIYLVYAIIKIPMSISTV